MLCSISQSIPYYCLLQNNSNFCDVTLLYTIESLKAFLHHILAQTSFNVQICFRLFRTWETNLIHYKLHFLHNLTWSMFISKGPRDWHSGQEPGLTSWLGDWKNGPRIKEHFWQSYFTMLSCGRMPVLLVTTPQVRINWFTCSCLQK